MNIVIDGEDIELISAEIAKYISDNSSLISILKQIKIRALQGKYSWVSKSYITDKVESQLKELGFEITHTKK